MSIAKTLRSAVSVVAIASASAIMPAAADTLSDDTAAEAETSISEAVQNEATAQIDEKRKALIDDATSALARTEEALAALDDSDIESAIEALAIAIGKLETVVAREPELALAPVSNRLIQRDLLADVAAVEAAREVIEDLIDDGKLQQARPLMRDFASEIIVETASLPLATYPDALLLATAQIDDGELDAARDTLLTALSTVIVTDEKIALPVLRAEQFIDAAEAALSDPIVDASEEVHADAEASTETSEAISLTPGDYVQAAREQLELAEALGYGTKKDFRELNDELDQLEAKIDAKQDADGILGTIHNSFDRLKDRLIGSAS